MREPAAEDVEAGVDVHGGVGSRGGVPNRGPCVVVDGKVSVAVTDRVVGQHLAVGQQGDVHPDHRPVLNRAPLAHQVLVTGDRGGRQRRVARVADAVFSAGGLLGGRVGTESSAAWSAGPSNPWCADAGNAADNRQTKAKAAASPKRTSTYSQ